MKPKPPLERDIKRQIMIETSKRVVWFNNPVGLAKDGKRKIKYGCGGKGASDLLGILRDGSGRFVACETKRPGKKATKEQVRFIELVLRAGAIGFVASSVEGVNRELDNQGGID